MMTLYNYCRPYLSEWSRKLFRNDEGQTMVEYVMLIVLVALAVFLLSPSVTNAITAVFKNTSSALASGPGSGS
jgi:Flp pilus assembly pilin Flp